MTEDLKNNKARATCARAELRFLRPHLESSIKAHPRHWSDLRVLDCLVGLLEQENPTEEDAYRAFRHAAHCWCVIRNINSHT